MFNHGVTRRRPTVSRLEKLVAVLKDMENDSSYDQDMRVVYMFYSTRGLQHPDYPDIAKEWLGGVYV